MTLICFTRQALSFLLINWSTYGILSDNHLIVVYISIHSMSFGIAVFQISFKLSIDLYPKKKKLDHHIIFSYIITTLESILFHLNITSSPNNHFTPASFFLNLPSYSSSSFLSLKSIPTHIQNFHPEITLITWRDTWSHWRIPFFFSDDQMVIFFISVSKFVRLRFKINVAQEQLKKYKIKRFCFFHFHSKILMFNIFKTKDEKLFQALKGKFYSCRLDISKNEMTH
jgi:hypothetical protein